MIVNYECLYSRRFDLLARSAKIGHCFRSPSGHSHLVVGGFVHLGPLLRIFGRFDHHRLLPSVQERPASRSEDPARTSLQVQ